MYFTEHQLCERQKQSIFRIKNLVKKNLLTLEDIASIIPGYVHLNNKLNFSISFLCNRGRNLIGYTQDELSQYGSEIISQHQSKNYIRKVHPMINNYFKSTNVKRPMSYMQDWRFDLSKENYSLFISSKLDFDDENYLTVTQGVDTIDKLAGAFLESFTDSKTLEEYFDSYFNLTNREVEILGFLAYGSSRKAIANELIISNGTVKKHCENVYKKLGTSDRIILLKIYNAFK
jgi:DNA-binding CsgD family transcriptional regulator